MDIRLGLDKVTLLLSSGELDFTPDFPATLDRPINAATGELLCDRVLYETKDGPVTGTKAYLNTPNFQLTVKPNRTAAGSVCLVQFSAGAYSDSNLVPLSRDDVSRCARVVENDLLALGLRFPVDKAKLVRADIAKNVEMSHPVACYAPVFQALSARKAIRKEDFGGTGFLMANGQRQVCFYDKGAEMLEKGYEPAMCPVNTVRPEVRLMKSGVIRDAIGADTLPQLRSSWENLHGAYLESLKRDVFRPKPEEKMDRALDAYVLARFILGSGSKRPHGAFLQEYGRLGLVRDMGVELAKEFFASDFNIDSETEAGKKQLYRIKVELDKAGFALQMQELTTDRKAIKELYRELKARVMG